MDAKIGRDIIVVDVGDKKVIVIKNPIAEDYKKLSKEVMDEYPNMALWATTFTATHKPTTRLTKDLDGNEYIWNGTAASHAQIELQLKNMFGGEFNQAGSTNTLTDDFERAKEILRQRAKTE